MISNGDLILLEAATIDVSWQALNYNGIEPLGCTLVISYIVMCPLSY